MANTNSSGKTPQKKSHELLERAYNACLADGFSPFDELNPYAPQSAVVECARRTMQRREDIRNALRKGQIVENKDAYNGQDPHGVFHRVLRQAGFDFARNNDDETIAAPALVDAS